MAIDEKHLESFFDENGNWLEEHNPWRDRDTPFMKAFFEVDDSDYVTISDEVQGFLYGLIERPKTKPMCDAVEMLCALNFSGNTKGNYDVSCYWRHR